MSRIFVISVVALLSIFWLVIEKDIKLPVSVTEPNNMFNYINNFFYVEIWLYSGDSC